MRAFARALGALLVGTVLAFAADPPTATMSAATTLSGAPLLNELRAGGYVLYFRHTATRSPRSPADRTSPKVKPR